MATQPVSAPTRSANIEELTPIPPGASQIQAAQKMLEVFRQRQLATINELGAKPLSSFPTLNRLARSITCFKQSMLYLHEGEREVAKQAIRAQEKSALQELNRLAELGQSVLGGIFKKAYPRDYRRLHRQLIATQAQTATATTTESS